jgi:hypothetical protein
VGRKSVKALPHEVEKWRNNKFQITKRRGGGGRYERTRFQDVETGL